MYLFSCDLNRLYQADLLREAAYDRLAAEAAAARRPLAPPAAMSMIQTSRPLQYVRTMTVRLFSIKPKFA